MGARARVRHTFAFVAARVAYARACQARSISNGMNCTARRGVAWHELLLELRGMSWRGARGIA
eukprot:1615138-Lingulodinium_polyedra.AAC.1